MNQVEQCRVVKKYELLTDDTITLDDGTVLYRIRALVDFSDVKAGELGGYIEKEANLDMSGYAWVYDEAWAYGNSWVSGNSTVFDDARVYGDARLSGNASVGDDARVYGDARLSGNARVDDDAVVNGRARVCGNARVDRDAWVAGDALVTDDAVVTDYAWVAGDVLLGGKALVGGESYVFGGTWEVPPLQIQGTKWFLNMASKTVLRIGCLMHKIPVWLEQYREIGKRNGATEAELHEYLLYIELAAKLYGLQGGDAE